jgi:hypothetical protein
MGHGCAGSLIVVSFDGGLRGFIVLSRNEMQHLLSRYFLSVALASGFQQGIARRTRPACLLDWLTSLIANSIGHRSPDNRNCPSHIAIVFLAGIGVNQIGCFNAAVIPIGNRKRAFFDTKGEGSIFFERIVCNGH